MAKAILAINVNCNYSASISKKIDVTYSSLTKIIQLLKKQGLIKINPGRRKKTLYLTEKGIKLQELLNEIKNL